MLLCIMVIFTACSKDPEVTPDTDNTESTGGTEKSEYVKYMESKLKDTSWQLTNHTNSSGSIVNPTLGGKISLYSTSSSNGLYDMSYFNVKYDDRNVSGAGSWKFFDDERLFLGAWVADNGVDIAATVTSILGGVSIIEKLTDKELVLRHDYDEGRWEKRFYSRISFIKKDSDNNGETDNNGNTGEAPQFVNYNFTATQNSITVNFYTDVSVSSGSIKYGTTQTSQTKSASATVASHQISATVKNLKSGTKYYFKCTAKNKYGSTTSDVYPAMTNY